jgi:thiol-disulfide isomerase/thioredoxin
MVTRAWTGALVGLLAGCAAAPIRDPGPRPGEVLLLDGSRVAWTSLLEREPTLAVFATPWCEVCRAERPAVQAWARSHRDQVRTLYVFSGGELPGALEKARGLGLDPGALVVVVDSDGAIADRHGVQATPTLLLLGRGGEVRATHHRLAEVQLP